MTRMTTTRLALAALLSLGVSAGAQATQDSPVQIVIAGLPGSHADIVGRLVATQLMTSHSVRVTNAVDPAQVVAAEGTVQLVLTGNTAAADRTLLWQLNNVPAEAKGGLPAPDARRYRLELASKLPAAQQQQLQGLLQQQLGTSRLQQQWQVYGLQPAGSTTLSAALN